MKADKKLKIAYFGTPYFSARFLEKLLTVTSIKRLIEVTFVVTQPDQPAGRNQIMTKSPVKLVANKFGIEVLEIDFKNSFQISNLKLTIKVVDIGFLFAYGGLLPKEIVNIPKLGFWNTHPSLLPKYRGALPIAMPLILGDKETGVTLIRLDEKVDHGPIIAQEKITILPTDKRPDLEIKLTDLAFELFKKKVYQLTVEPANRLTLIKQDSSKATYTYQLKKDDSFIPLDTLKKALTNEKLNMQSVPKFLHEYLKRNNVIMKQWNNQSIYNLFRGLYPWPGIWTKIDIKGQLKRLKIVNLAIKNDHLTINRVQLEGKKEVDFKTFNSAYSVF